VGDSGLPGSPGCPRQPLMVGIGGPYVLEHSALTGRPRYQAQLDACRAV